MKSLFSHGHLFSVEVKIRATWPTINKFQQCQLETTRHKILLDGSRNKDMAHFNESVDEDLVKAFEKMSSKRRASAVTIGESSKLRQERKETKTADNEIKSEYKVLVLGMAGTGKTSLICQLLYDSFPEDHVLTVEEMYRLLKIRT